MGFRRAGSTTNASRKKEITMRRAIIVAAIGSLLGFANVSQAAQIASPTIYGAFSQRVAQCTIGNLGTSTIFVDVNIVDEAGNVVRSNEHCGNIEPNFLCQVSALSIPTGAAFACTATTKGSTTKLRGSFALLDANGAPIRSVEMH
jgi:hypothetical protein